MFLITALSVTATLSASNGDKILPKNEKIETVIVKDKREKNAQNASVQDCVTVNYHGCTHATTCISEFTIEAAMEWVEKIENNYCNN